MDLVFTPYSLYIRGRVFYKSIVGEYFHTFFCYASPTQKNNLDGIFRLVSGPNCSNEAN